MKFTYFRGLQYPVRRSASAPNAPVGIAKASSFTQTHLKLTKIEPRKHIIANYINSLEGTFAVGTFTIAEGQELANVLGVPFLSAKTTPEQRVAMLDLVDSGSVRGIVFTFALASYLVGYKKPKISHFISTVYSSNYQTYLQIGGGFNVVEIHQIVDNVPIRNTASNMLKNMLVVKPVIPIEENVESRQCFIFDNPKKV